MVIINPIPYSVGLNNGVVLLKGLESISEPCIKEVGKYFRTMFGAYLRWFYYRDGQYVRFDCIGLTEKP